MKRPNWQAALLATVFRFADSQSAQASREYALVLAVVAATAVITLTAVGLSIAGSLPGSLDGLAETLNRVRPER